MDRHVVPGEAGRRRKRSVVFALAVLLVYLVLAAQYESWLMPAAVILVVPLALLGTVAAVAVRGMDNNIYTQIGIVLIIALASKNAILIVEFARELRRTGRSILRRGGRGGAAAVPADPDDVVRVHPGRLPAGERRRRRGRQPPVARHRGLRRHDRLDGAGRLLRAGVLRGDAAAERVQAKTGGGGEYPGRGFASRAGRGVTWPERPHCAFGGSFALSSGLKSRASTRSACGPNVVFSVHVLENVQGDTWLGSAFLHPVI